MFKKGPDIDKKKLLLKASDVKKDSLTRLKHFKTLIEHLDFNELPQLFKSHFSFIYHTFIESFSAFDCNSKQRREDLECILFMLEKILVYNPDLIKKRWQFYSISFVMQKLLHRNNAWRCRQEGVRLFLLWYQILCDDTNADLQLMFASLVPGIIMNVGSGGNSSQVSSPSSAQAPYLHSQQSGLMSGSGPPPVPAHGPQSSVAYGGNMMAGPQDMQGPIKFCTVEPLVPALPNDQPLADETSFYLDILLQFMVTQITKPHWSSPDEARKNQELSFSFVFNVFKRVYLSPLFPGFQLAGSGTRDHGGVLKTIHSIDEYVDDPSSGDWRHSRQMGPAASTGGRREQMRLDLRGSVSGPAASQSQSIIIRWLTRIMRQDSILGQDELMNKSSGSVDRQAQLGSKLYAGGREQQSQVSGDPNSTMFQNMDTSSRELDVARRVIGTWAENIAVVHEIFRRAFLSYNQPASMKRVVNVYKEWIYNGGPNQSTGGEMRIGYVAYIELLQTFVLNSSEAFLAKVNNTTMLDDQVEMCKRIMNIYRFMVMKVYMNSETWEQILDVMLNITKQLFPPVPPDKKETTIGGRIAPAFFQTFVVSWIRANLYVHIPDQMWAEFHHVMRNLIRWRELIQEWSSTMGNLTRVLVKHVYGLNLGDLPLDRRQERRVRRPRAMKSFSTAESSHTTSPTTSPAHRVAEADSSPARNQPAASNPSASGSPSRHAPVERQAADASNRATPTAGMGRAGVRVAHSVAVCARDQLCVRGLVRSNSDGILCSSGAAKYYVSSLRADAHGLGAQTRRYKSEHALFEGSYFDQSGECRSNGDVLDGTSLRDTNMLALDAVDNHASQPTSMMTQVAPNGATGKQQLLSDQSSRQQVGAHKPEPKSTQDRCVLLGGSVRGWTAENSVIMWRRMLGLFGNVNHIDDPDNHLVAMGCLASITRDFLRTRENLAVSVDNTHSPGLPELIPPYTFIAGWLLEATHLPRQFRESRLTAYKLLCMLTVRRHDAELSSHYYAAFYESLNRGLNSPDQQVHAAIVKHGAQLLSLEISGCTFLAYALLERARSVLLTGANTSQQLLSYQPPSPTGTMGSSSQGSANQASGGQPPRTQSIQILSSLLALNKPLKRLPVLRPDPSGSGAMSMAPLADCRPRILDTLFGSLVIADADTRRHSLGAVAIHIYQELSDRLESPDLERLFDVITCDLLELSATGASAASPAADLFRFHCDLLRLFADHATTLILQRTSLVAELIQTLCQLLVRASLSIEDEPGASNPLDLSHSGAGATGSHAHEAINCLLLCLECWCLAAGKSFMTTPVSVDTGSLAGLGGTSGRNQDENLDDSQQASSSANTTGTGSGSGAPSEPLITWVLKSLDMIINGEQQLQLQQHYGDETSVREARGSMSTSRGSDALSQSQQSQSSATAPPAAEPLVLTRDRTLTNESQSRADLAGRQRHLAAPAGGAVGGARNDSLKHVKLACKLAHQRLVTHLGQFPFKQIGAASVSCCVAELDYLAPGAETAGPGLGSSAASLDLRQATDACLLLLDGSTIVTLIADQTNRGSVQLIVRSLCGKYAWHANQLGGESVAGLASRLPADARRTPPAGLGAMCVDPESFQQPADSRANKFEPEAGDTGGHSGSSLSSRASLYRDCIEDLMYSLASSSASSGSVSSHSTQTSGSNSYQKKRNSALSCTNSRLKVASAEETMIALLTNQRFQELNYCERSNDLDRVLLTFGGGVQAAAAACQPAPAGWSAGAALDQCRQLVQHLGYLSWEKRRKVESLAKSVRLARELNNLDAQPARETHKIAVLYAANGQEDKNSILANSAGSRAFDEFVAGLGWPVNLASHLGFMGGLQANKSTGDTSCYYCNATTEVMFHISTRLGATSGPSAASGPNSAASNAGSAAASGLDDEVLNKKLRHLGNDEVHIVWSEHTRDYRRGIIPTEFGDVIIAIYPMLTFANFYRVHISVKADVAPFGPLADNSVVHMSSLAALVRATAINASRAKRLRLPYYQSQAEERGRLIEAIARNHTERLSFEDFASQLYLRAPGSASLAGAGPQAADYPGSLAGQPAGGFQSAACAGEA